MITEVKFRDGIRTPTGDVVTIVRPWTYKFTRGDHGITMTAPNGDSVLAPWSSVIYVCETPDPVPSVQSAKTKR
jgi:hypothetical protein